ncbi:PKD domain-containing protein [Taibaiella lutea]|uniref:PKD domain-containing protein n=1 Tax=Taibaiella lutea TaxID=2608001 RepID=A0A5M6CDL6_9BACT|nr:PKD domain-containing protein [Taibaiella lutea]KAA5533216.1 PKD domain-containing protein [Taibaiella lutea]
MKKIFFLLLCFITAGTTALNAQTCNAAFGWQANPNGNNIWNVDFYNSSSSSSGSNTYSMCTINYGDGSAVQYFGTGSPSTSHNYANSGTYNVTVSIQTYDSSSSGNTIVCSDVETQVVTISGSACASTVATQNNGSGSYTFTATNPAGTSGMTYSWDFGDGNTGSGNPVTHTYSTGGNYTVTLTSTGGGCSYTNAQAVNYFSSTFNCSSATAGFTSTVNNSLVQFTNTSSGNQNVPGTMYQGSWDFGDGTTSTFNYPNTYTASPTHNYTSTGTYSVTLTYEWVDSSGNQVLCTKTATNSVTVTNLTNYIDGYIWGDTAYNNPGGFTSDVKVWLIVHDANANTLTAVDSVALLFTPFSGTHYQFDNVPAGDYLVKAAVQGQTAGTTGWLPTYHDASVYWTNANTINHTGNISTDRNINMQSGTVTSGPGFIGGNISAGAGKGTGTGVEGMLVYLRGNNNQLIALAFTNAEGDYSFSNIPTGTYSVYPEAINYATTPYNTINVTASQAHVSAIDFEQTNDEIKPKNTTGITKVSEKDGLKIYPNPAKNSFTIDNQNGLFNEVKIMNAVGQLIKEISLKNGINKVDVSEMNAGIYYLLISGNDSSRSMKLVKQ